jgi:nuclear cap-binding protein subunit 1
MNGMPLSNPVLNNQLTHSRSEDLSLSDLHPKKAFIIAALDREIRLSFAKRIRSTLPEQMHSLIPARLDDDKSPDFKYESEGV